MDRAGFFTRFFALVIDGVVMAVVTSVLMFVWMIFAAGASQTDSAALGVMQAIVGMFVYLAAILLQFLYFGYYWSKTGQTLGMRLLNIKVVMQGGETLSFMRAALRGTIGYWISGFFFGLGYIWAAFDAKGEAWHDKLFDTHVVPS